MLSILPINMSAKDLGLFLGDEPNALANGRVFFSPFALVDLA